MWYYNRINKLFWLEVCEIEWRQGGFCVALWVGGRARVVVDFGLFRLRARVATFDVGG